MEFTQGMQPDGNLYSSIDGSWAMAKNVRRVNGVIEVDYGTVNVHDLGGNVVGTCNIGTELIIMTSEGINDVDRIYKFNGTSITTILKADLNLDPDNELEIVYKYNKKNEIVIAFIDSINQLRTLNIDDLPFIHGIDPITKEISSLDDLALTKVGVEYKVPIFKLSAGHGGELGLGVYQVSIRYKYKDVISKWSILSDRILLLGESNSTIIKVNPQNSFWPHSPGDNQVNWLPYLSSESSDNVINVRLTELDKTYESFDIAIVKSLSTGGFESTCGIISNVTIPSSGTKVVYINGSYNTYVEIDEILATPFSIYKPKALTNFRDKLFVGNYETKPPSTTLSDQIDKVSLKWIIKKGINSKQSTFKWGEVYAFYGAFLYKDGSISQFEHIKGRALEASDLVDYVTTDDNMLNASPKNFHIEDTTTNITQDADSNIIGDFGAWQNENEFYDDAGQDNVRHHRFPHKDIIMDPSIAGWDVPSSENAKRYPTLGIIVDTSLVTMPDDVQGMVISYAKRDLNNATALDDGVYHKILRITVESDEITRFEQTNAISPYVMINNRYVSAYAYLRLIHTRFFNMVEASNCTYHIPNLTFRIEHNVIQKNEWTGDILLFTLDTVSGVIDSMSGSAFTIMNDIRDIYNSRFNQTLVFATYVKNGVVTESFNGDVFTSLYYSLQFAESAETIHRLISEIRVACITSPIIQDTMEVTGLPIYENQLKDEFEKGVQTFSIDRYYSRLKGASELCTNKAFILIEDITKLNNKMYNDIVQSYAVSTEYNNWLLFNANDYYTVQNINGGIYQLITYGNALYIRTDRSLYIAKIRDTFDMTNGTVGLKSGELFDQLPQELMPTSTGFMQANSKFATFLSKLGVVLVDITTASIYILGAELVDLTITNKEYFKTIMSKVKSSHLSSLLGVSVCHDSRYNRLFITIRDTILSFDVMTKQLISTHTLPNNYMFSLLGKESPYYIHTRINNYGNTSYTISKLDDSQFPDESYIDISIASEKLPSFGLNDVSWITVGGVANTLESIAIWTELGATGTIDIDRVSINMVNGNDVITGNTSFDVDGVYRFNEIFDRVVDHAISMYSAASTKYDVQINPSNIDSTNNATDLFGTQFKIRFYLKKSSRTIINRNCKLKSIGLNLKSYTSNL